MTGRRTAAEAPDGPIPVPVTGTVVEEEAGVELVQVTPTPSEITQAADRAVGRTAIQVGLPTALVGIGTYLFRLWDIDLDPGAGRDMPADVVGYFIAAVTILVARKMNPKPKA